jgi:rRNA maturation endonuclease Nob1
MDEKLVTLTTYQFLAEAEIARMHLAQEGIESFIADGQTITMDWFLGNALGYIKLQVAESQAERALAIMAKWPKPRSRSDIAASDLEPLRCLACGKRMLEDQIECEECGWSYLADAEETETGDSARPAGERASAFGEEREDEPGPLETGIQRNRTGPKPRPFDHERPIREEAMRCPSCDERMRADESECAVCGWSQPEPEENDAPPQSSIRAASEGDSNPPDTRIQRDRPRPKRPDT